MRSKIVNEHHGYQSPVQVNHLHQSKHEIKISRLVLRKLRREEFWGKEAHPVAGLYMAEEPEDEVDIEEEECIHQ